MPLRRWKRVQRVSGTLTGRGYIYRVSVVTFVISSFVVSVIATIPVGTSYMVLGGKRRSQTGQILYVVSSLSIEQVCWW